MGAGWSSAQSPETKYHWLLNCEDSLIKYASNPTLEAFEVDSTKFLALAYEASEIPTAGSSSHIRFALSKDGGETWTSTKVVQWGLAPLWAPVLFYHNERLHLVYCESRKAYSPGGDIKIMHTEDAGQTWSSPLTIYTHEEDGEVPKVVANKPAIDSDGTTYLPFHTEPLKSYEVFNSKTWHPLKEAAQNGDIPSIQCPATAKDQGVVTFAGCLVSKDGAHWTVAGHIEDAKTWLIQPSIEKTTDNDLLMLFRTTGKIYSARSSDKGTTWSKPAATSIINPNAKFSTVTIDGQILMVHNPSPQDHKSLVLSLSVDNGKRWEVLCPVDTEINDPTAIVVNPCIVSWSQDTVKIAYTVWGKGLKLATLKLATVDS